MDIINIKLESEIMKKVHADNGATVHFNWDVTTTESGEDESVSSSPHFEEYVEFYTLELITFNPLHEEPFLCHTVKGKSKHNCLKEMRDYIVSHEDLGIQSWTIEWMYKGKHGAFTSYFSGKDEEDVLNKFYHGKDKDTIILLELKLNPIS